MLDPFAVTFVFTSISIPYIYVYVSTCYVLIDNKWIGDVKIDLLQLIYSSF